jgi:hypothetical protein
MRFFIPMKRKAGIPSLNILCKLFVMPLVIATWKILDFREFLLPGAEGESGNALTEH